MNYYYSLIGNRETVIGLKDELKLVEIERYDMKDGRLEMLVSVEGTDELNRLKEAGAKKNVEVEAV